MELVGAYAWSPEKVGKDVGELIGIAPLGITATDDVDALLALEPDVVGYYQMLFPDAIEQHVEMMCRFLEAGVNVVSTSNLITGRWWGAEERFNDGGEGRRRVAVRRRREPGVGQPARAHRDRRVQRGQAHLDLGRGRVLGLQLAGAVAVGRLRAAARRARAPRHLQARHDRVRGRGGDDGRRARPPARRGHVRTRRRARDRRPRPRASC